jgi:hypothetical protein
MLPTLMRVGQGVKPGFWSFLAWACQKSSLPDNIQHNDRAGVVESADTQDLKSCELYARTGSSPVPGIGKGYGASCSLFVFEARVSGRDSFSRED